MCVLMQVVLVQYIVKWTLLLHGIYILYNIHVYCILYICIFLHIRIRIQYIVLYVRIYIYIIIYI